MKEKVLVTGGAGFVGPHVVVFWFKEGPGVVVFVVFSGGFFEN